MEVTNSGMNLKEMLAAGNDPRDLMKEFQNQLMAAENELKEEKVKEAKLHAIARNKVVNAMYEYLEILGLFGGVDETESKELKNTIYTALRECEIEFQPLIKPVGAVGSKSKGEKDRDVVPNNGKDYDDETIDQVLKNFLRSL